MTDLAIDLGHGVSFGPSAQAERAEPPLLREHDTEQYDAPDIRRNRR